MKYVEIYESVGDGYELLGTVSYDEGEGKLVFDNIPENMIKGWERIGIPYQGLIYTIKDGEDFLVPLSVEYKGSMIRSSAVKEK